MRNRVKNGDRVHICEVHADGILHAAGELLKVLAGIAPAYEMLDAKFSKNEFTEQVLEIQVLAVDARCALG